MPQSLPLPLPFPSIATSSSSPFLSKLTHPHFFSNSSSRWTLLAIGGTTVVATAVIGGTLTRDYWCCCCSSTTHSGSSSSEGELSSTRTTPDSESAGGMFSVAWYLAEKISGFIPWRAAASALDTVGRKADGVELGERNGRIENGGGRLTQGDEEWAEGKRKMEIELEALRGEVERLKRELGEGKGKGVVKEVGSVEEAKEGEEQRVAGESEADPTILGDPYTVTWDSVSEDEVVLLLKSLNTEISDLAHAITRAFASVSRPQPRLPSEDLSDEAKEAIAGVAEILGPRIVELLQLPPVDRQRGSSEDDGDSVKMALRASMATYTHWIISSWYFENPEDEHLLSEIYARVRETEEQGVSGRWRALTRRHLQRMLATDPDLTIYMVDAFVNIILTAEWHNDGAALQEYLVQTFGEKIGSVLEKAKRLNKVIGEEIMRCDLEALYIAPDVAFNHGTMEVERQGGAEIIGKRSARVLCTTELGLVRAEKKTGKVGEWDEAVLLKPNVVLQLSGVGGV